jgi:hypothetical protein
LLSLQQLQAQAQMQTALAAAEIKILSQKLANDYLFFYYDPIRFQYFPKLRENVQSIEKDLRLIAKDSSNEDVHAVLDYLSYTKDKLYDLLDESINAANTQKVLDYTDSLVEGVNAILKSLHANLFKEELQYHILRVSKLYMAIHLQFSPSENRKMLFRELHSIESMTQHKNRNIYTLWHTYKRLFDPVPDYFIPHIVTIAVEDLRQSVDKL